MGCSPSKEKKSNKKNNKNRKHNNSQNNSKNSHNLEDLGGEDLPIFDESFNDNFGEDINNNNNNNNSSKKGSSGMNNPSNQPNNTDASSSSCNDNEKNDKNDQKRTNAKIDPKNENQSYEDILVQKLTSIRKFEQITPNVSMGLLLNNVPLLSTIKQSYKEKLGALMQQKKYQKGEYSSKMVTMVMFFIL